MANTTLFGSIKSKLPRTDTVNEAGGRAYQFTPKHALAQMAATGCFNGVFYASAQSQLDETRQLIDQVDDNVFLAKLAVYARERAYMKDMPAALLVVLSRRDTELLHRVFDRVVDNARRALFGWLTDKQTEKWAPATEADLPAQVQGLIAYRQAETAEAQALLLADLSVRWDLLADAAKGPLVWKAIARQMGPQTLRMNLNTLLRHEVFSVGGGKGDQELVDCVAGRIAEADEIRRSRQFPYQFLAAYLNADESVPQKVKAALHQAAETACGNVPELPGPVVIGPDTSGSMRSPVTGYRGRGATSKMRCVDVAALFAAAILRRNPDNVVIPFDTAAYEARLDPQDTVLSLAERLAKYGGGGTDCSLPLVQANGKYAKRRFAGCVLVSDNESWVYRNRAFAYGGNGATSVMTEWQKFVANQKRLGVASPKLVCIDIQPYGSTQAPERADILNVGGFSDAVFHVVASYVADDAARFVAEVEAIDL